ncbi:MAG: aminotransferase DegT [Alkaliphilus sp.]|nr:MAG: aminotransferase DegT [Alkaliphilus sp.]
MSQKFIPLSVPNLKGRELEYVTHAVKTEWVSTGGPYVNEFEEKTATYVNSKGAVSCQNGTAGLHIALQVCGVTKDDEVIVPTLTFIAAVNPVKYIGAEPVFMDCDDSLAIDTNKLLEFCKNECRLVDGRLINKKTKKHIRAVLVVHVFGNMADMEKIMEIADEFNLQVVEDATEAIGTYYTKGKYKDRHAGTIGNVGVYSYNGNKIITTGGGGMIVSDDDKLLKRAKHLTTQAKSDEIYYTHDEIGYNYRMTNLQAALGLAQLEQLEDFIKTKKNNYELYKEKIKDIAGLSLLEFKDNTRSNYWFYALNIDKEYPLNRDEVIKYLSSKKVQARPIWGLINEQKPYLNNQTYKIKKAKQYLEHIVNIPCSSNLTKEDILYIVECLKKPK